ncbi:uncharacterized protein LOC128256633 [Drosophila gunungcola]|uniref:DUF753 domain-containing protein n=1 Tax=Drosophila gunungcola TaxID=103775 RepID=A0A9P9YFE1_9MUSC|nr:uncharacterized protein LOC128256633 [Drosophila gunungcola]KAI8035949.1 hypothetical protein M5D96_011380 [Drosophila gunungcola]
MLQSGLFLVSLAILLGSQEISGVISTEVRNAADLPKCYSCEGVNCMRTTRQNATVSCSDKLDVCVTIYEDFAVSERGCFSEISLAGQAKCAAKDNQCQKCSGQLCNNQGRRDFKCIQCIGSESASCNMGATGSLTASQCGLPTSANSYCYVKVVGSQKDQLQRGCALSVKEQQSCKEDSECSLCIPDNSSDSVACNNFDLDLSSKSGADQGQKLISLGLASIALLFLKVLN